MSVQGVALILLLLWFWLAGTVLVAYVAEQKNRSALGWSLLSLFIVGPLFALIALAAVPSRANNEATEGEEAEMTPRTRRM
jgi:hypothetical protein